MNYLARLIQERMDDHKWSLADVSARAGNRPDGKPALPRTTLHNLIRRKPGMLPPKPATLDALAKGLSLPKDVIGYEAARDAGYNLPPLEETAVSMSKYKGVRIIADLAQELSDEDFEEIIRIAEREAARLTEQDQRRANGA